MTHRVLVAAAAVLLATLVTGCGGEGATLGKQTLSFKEKQNDDSFSFADNPPKSSPSNGDEPKLSNGDQITFTADMSDSSGKDVGDLDVTCTVTATTTGSFDDSRAQCVGTATIPGGTLTLTGGESLAPSRAFTDTIWPPDSSPPMPASTANARNRNMKQIEVIMLCEAER